MEHQTTSAQTIIREESNYLAYISMVMILLLFFIYLNSLRKTDLIRSSNVLDSVSRNFEGEEFSSGVRKATKSIIDVASQANFAIEREADRIVLTIPGASLFESGDDTLRAEVVSVLGSIADQVRESGISVTIEGHTDSNPIHTDRFPSNWELSTARAISVLRLFLQHGVSVSQLSASGRAESNPVASNESEEGRARNRRVVLMLEGQSEG